MQSRSRSMLRRFLSSTPNTSAKAKRSRLQIQSLEDRTVPASFVVTTLADTGTGSLRDMVTQANATAAADVITFDPTLFAGGPQTLTLASALPDIPSAGGALTITGPGINTLTINRTTGTFRFVNQTATTVANTLTITDMQMRAGNSASGGALQYAGFVVLERMNFSNNISSSTGGAVRGLTASNLTVRDSIFSGNSGTSGGGIYVASTAPTVTIERTVFSGNTATTGNGGAIRVGSGAFFSIKDSTLSGNTAANKGGAVYHFGTGGITIEGTTFNNNATTSTSTANGGGALYMFGDPSAAPPSGFTASTYVIRNSTFSGNTTAGSGGAILDKSGTTTGQVLIQNSTIAGNTSTNASATYGGGGIFRSSTAAKTFTFQNTILAGNTHSANPNMRSAGSGVNNLNFSAIDNTTGFTLSGSSGNNVTSSFAAMNLGPLANNGGLTQTRLPGTGTLINAGSNALIPGGMSFDQRGSGFARILEGTVEIGAVETIPPGNPTATATVGNITTAGATTHTITVNYKDLLGPNQGLDTTSIIGNNNAIRVTGPNGYNQLATYTSIDGVGDPNDRTVVYTITAPGGTWGPEDVGTYTVKIESNQIYDLNGEAVIAATLTTFNVSAPQTLIVTNTTDADPGSLRDIINQANANLNPDTIIFDPTVFNTPGTTISLLSALPAFASSSVAGAITLQGPGSNLLTVQRDASAATNFAIFTTNNAGMGFSGLTITGGNAGSAALTFTGGGSLTDVKVTGNTSTTSGTIRTTGSLSLLNSTISGNTVTGSGGAIYALAGSTLNIVNSTISGNTASVGGGGIRVASGVPVNILNSTFDLNTATADEGGGMFLNGTNPVTIINSTISGNSAANNGGGVYFFNGGSLLLENSTVNGNIATGTTAGYGGGGVYFFGTASSFIVRNSTIANNNSGSSGGGILLKSFTGTADIQNSTIVGNNAATTAASNGGGGIGRFSGAGVINITNSIVAGNTIGTGSSVGPDIMGSGTSKESAIGNVTGYTDADGTTNIAPGTDLMLSPLGNYGGTTQTIIPLPGSPLVDAGDSTLMPPTTTTDQLGGAHVRVYGANVDIGSFEVQPPAVTVNQAVGQADPTNGAIVFDIVFATPVTGFDLSDVVLSSAVGGTASAITGSGTTYQVTVTGMSGVGDVSLTVPADVATDLAGSLNAASTSTDNVVTFDDVAPTATIDQATLQADPTNVPSINFTVAFNDAVVGFDASDITFTGSTAPGVLSAVVTPIDALTYTVTVTGMTGSGLVVASFGAGAATDLAGNANIAPTSTDNTVAYDVTAPTVTIEQAAGQADATGGSSATGVLFTVVFSEPVVNFSTASVDLTGTTAPGATVTNVSGTGTTYTVTVSGMTGGGLIKASVPAFSGATDLAGNGNDASTSVDNEVTFALSGTVQFSAPTYSVSENGVTVTVTVTRDGGSEGDLSVDYSTTAVSATDGADYTGVTGTLTWLAGDTTSRNIVITINDDTILEPTETFDIQLRNVTVPNALGTPSTATVSITDYEEGDITFSAPTYTAVEPDAVNGLATIVIQRLNGGNGAVDVTYNMTLGTAEATDIGTPTPNIVSGTLSWADGDTADKVITIPILMDTLSEGYETVNFALTAPTNGAVLGANPNAVLTIQPSDPVKINALTGFKALKFTDTDQDTVFVSLGGKTGLLDVYKTDDVMPISVITTTATDPAKSTVTVTVVKAKKAVNPAADGKVTIGEVAGTGLKSFTALKSDIVDSGFNFSGFIGSIKVGNILNGADIVALGLPTQKTVIVAGTIGDNSVINLGSTLQLLSAASVGDSDIVSPRVGSIVVKGAFGADITLAGTGVDHTKFKTMNLLNVGGPITGMDVNITGGIGAIVAKNDLLNSNVTAFNLNGMTVLGAMTNTDVTLNGTGVNHLKKAKTLGAVTVKKAVTDSDIVVTGNIGAVTVYGFKNSRLFGGYTGADDGSGTFNLAIPTTISAFKSLPNTKLGLTGAFENSSVIASIINAVVLGAVTENNGGADPFGIFVDSKFGSVSILDTKQKFVGATLPVTGFTDQDFNIKVK